MASRPVSAEDNMNAKRANQDSFMSRSMMDVNSPVNEGPSSAPKPKRIHFDSDSAPINVQRNLSDTVGASGKPGAWGRAANQGHS